MNSPAEIVATQTIAPVVPLDAQLGVAEPLQVPANLEEVLFGGAPEIETYAVLDAARVVNLADTLEMSGLDHVSLFAGPQIDEWRDVAPYLVRLTRDAVLTRNLFTASPDQDVAWHLWAKAPGVFIRSDKSIDALRTHLRRFVQPEVNSGKRLIFRFWEPRFLHRYLATFHPDGAPHVTAFLDSATFVIPDHVAGSVVVQRLNVPSPGRARGPWRHLVRDSAKIRFALFRIDLPLKMAKRFPALAKLDETDRRSLFGAMIDDAIAMRITDVRAIEQFCLACLLLGGSPRDDARFQTLVDSPQHELDRARKMLDLARSLAEGAA